MTECGIACLHGVTRSFPGEPEVEALREVDLIVRPAEFVTIAGPSGAGKSTLVNLLGLLDTPSSGIVHTQGLPVSGLTDRERAAIRGALIGFVFQAFHLMGGRSLIANVALAGAYHGVPRRTRLKRAERALEQVGLGHRLQAQGWTLSGGERQRAALARALAAEPAILLCDEPTGNLDPGAAAQVIGLLRETSRKGIAVVVITHDLGLAALGDRRIRLVDGQLQEQR